MDDSLEKNVFGFIGLQYENIAVGGNLNRQSEYKAKVTSCPCEQGNNTIE